MKRNALVIGLIVAIMLSISYKNSNTESKLINNDKSMATIYREIKYEEDNQNNIVDTKLSLDKVYKSISQLNEDSDIIIEGNVISAKSEMDTEYSAITYLNTKIYDVFKKDSDNIKEGNNVCIIDRGGTISKEILMQKYKEKFPNLPITHPEVFKTIKFTNDGVSPLEVGADVIIYAKKLQNQIDNKNCYVILGGYQGKFLIEGGNVKHQVPKVIEDDFHDKFKTKKELVDLIKVN